MAEKLPVHGAAHGFLSARSIVSNARAHAGADVIVKIDVKDFFPTVTWRRVKGLFRKAGLTENTATLLASRAMPLDPPAAPVVEEHIEAAPAPLDYDADVKPVALALAKANREELLDILRGFGAMKATQLEPAQYAAFIASCKRAME